MNGLELRIFEEVGLEVRAGDGADAKRKIAGTAVVYNRLSTPIYGLFREQFAPGAFTKVLKNADVRALFNHDPNLIVGRTKSGTLILTDSDTGLRFEVDPPATPWADGLIESIRRRDIDQVSFAFRALKDKWTGTLDAPIRTVIEADIRDVSPVTYAAYPQTDVHLRSDMGGEDKLTALMGLAYRSAALSHADEAELRKAIAKRIEHDTEEPWRDLDLMRRHIAQKARE